jgi:diacylglycerol kinase family enzyme
LIRRFDHAMTQRTAFVVNRYAGGGLNDAWLATHRVAMGAIANGGPITLVANGTDIASAVQRALELGCKAIVAGGGDGTLNAVASHIVGSATLFGILPLGTLNHFAKDLGIPLDTAQALATIAEGRATTVDVGEVNGRFFLNNSSLGLYPDIVRDRERQQHRLGRGKWLAFIWAVWGAMRRYPFLRVQLTVDGDTSPHRTPFVFVGNNAYQMQGFQIGSRPGLRDGVLSVYLAHDTGRVRLLALGLRALAGRLRQTRDFHALLAQALTIETRHRQLRVAIDGEVLRMQAPLHYRIHAAALRVIAPPSQPGTP